MLNSSSWFFILGAYVDVGSLKYFYFLVMLTLYLLILLSNMSLVVVICVNRSLHEPMYMFLCSLFVNELYGSTGLFPFLLVQILSDVHLVPAWFCFLQIYCLYTYVNVEFCNLAVMSYDRYLAICHPLHYHTCMSRTKVLVLILLLWFYSLIKFLITLSLNVRLSLCGNVLNSLYCRNYLVVKLACSDTEVNNVYGLLATSVSICVPLLPILFSYMKILRICLSGSRRTRQKAVSTCSPHLASLINFSFACFFEIIQTRFDVSGAPTALRTFVSLYVVVLQPLLSPVMYSLQMSKIRSTCRELLRRKTCKTWTGQRTKD